jgi:hypothetical protein
MTAEQVRELALALPEAEERETWGFPTFRIRDKMFLTLPGDGIARFPAEVAAQQALVGSDPETFSVSPRMGRHGWVQVDLTRVDAGELRELVEEAWRRTAPRRLVAAFDHEGDA